LPSTGEAQLGQTMPCRGMACHHRAISLTSHLQLAPPCPGRSLYSPEPARAFLCSPRRMHTRASTCPDTPRHAHARARARMAPALDAPERDDAHRLASPPPSLSVPVDARHHPDAPGHGHLPAGTPQVTSASTTDRHDLRAPVKLTAAVDPRLHRQHARQPRQDTSNQ
jgi:hypothetical protein